MKRIGWLMGVLLGPVPALPAQVVFVPTPGYLVQDPGFSIKYARVKRTSAFVLKYTSGYGLYSAGGFSPFGPAFGSPFGSTPVFNQVVIQRPPIIIPPAAPP